ncbi:MAG: outer membrane beta-barrel protein [Bacteroidaceae bacterium]|nr:outer membrane beta-barrel protein [Bacteroidaceae bacterium]
MNKFYKLIALCAIILLCGNQAAADARWGVIASMNINDLRFNHKLQQGFENKSVSGIGIGGSAGVIGELVFAGIGFGVDGAILYSNYGSKCYLGQYPTWSEEGVPSEFVYRTHNIEIPLNLLFKYRNLDGIEHYIAPLAFVGPSLTINVGDNQKELIAKGVEISLHVGVGCEILEKFQFRAMGYFGISDTCRTLRLDNFNATKRGLAFSLIYFF